MRQWFEWLGTFLEAHLLALRNAVVSVFLWFAKPWLLVWGLVEWILDRVIQFFDWMLGVQLPNIPQVTIPLVGQLLPMHVIGMWIGILATAWVVVMTWRLILRIWTALPLT